ncbi:pas pac sensor hybrid histidine kinase : PAS/PAC sensor hybrid histidine kinase OS=Haliangium ochraceum (strain DSM 14365 / JCM 11303 / SMP-2) GN=Hoch_3141 PE=4 SV=1: GAF_2: HisKA: HATPase_c: Response_reg: PAS_9: HisKA: HATPase_c: Response_reg [Gemmataceae bacterium]|nr:pas pac sensor hybrid histidine kinase : PAS/PAC sensor hybrid histidine kinase OS=Haliangium ochraceum (strain DSM 14365 / JCM 11303 / SMP-2) GN=Hoch_3141 PE=4 SV=1: GAF_2: HisKA: HATPase_c: Response_reg: PAS_9: HisKA: HATPase_c: Response_reg [Gemmataceae bacterium]VTT96645.1 pas pac sensor hybrid histidine kinase : PAS/PAC sensor hybrid histidine kinase OS=Haliangium ochraceum (strain DSM 14365 / JCM 11303 / SMP-2) GN=Hoch_3141 PE=4 SV=1: GAF_2: HisKA: HATPase_c: Response_reg: PAS_9: HisKA: H
MTEGTRPPPDPDPAAPLAPRGEMGERTLAFDWSKTPVGPRASWPQSLRTIVRVMLDSRYAMWLGWGPEFTFFYNDAYARMTLGAKHPWALGRPAREVWAEIWGDIGPRAESVVRTGTATWDEGLLLFLERNGFPEETYHTFSYSPVPDDSGGVGGMLCVVTEDTERTVGDRRLRTLRELAARTTEEVRSVADACATAAHTLDGHSQDLPFALIYLLSDDARTAALAGASGVPPGSPAAPPHLDLADPDPAWPLGEVLATGRPVVVGDLVGRFGTLPGGPWPEPTRQAVVVPVAKPGQVRPGGFLVAGVSPRLPLTDPYRGFLDLLAGHVATAVANARAYEEQRRRAEALAELDRAKTAFFSNVSHEFRTPLTLMLGPIEDALAGAGGPLDPHHRERLEVAHRNGLRLQRLVNALLDFSRIEAGRARARYEPTDLAGLTADLASNFRSACERAGLGLRVECPPLGEPVYVDPHMWEKVVLNLLSNAFKFTFEGEIAVTVREVGGAAEVRVSDTGTGVPTEEIPRLFERFHRVENARGRTHEGSGIGLALVQELVRLHGGTIAAASEVGRGTAFTITLPFGSAHLPSDQVRAAGPAPPRAHAAATFVEEALRWLPAALVPAPAPAPVPDRPRVLVADDNADMRDYVARLLAAEYAVEVVADGEAALAAVRRQRPDLIVSDVMMPRLDGFGLLRGVRADPATAAVPVVLLSARAGEESRVEAAAAGADDYLVKPFAARELLARVSAQLQLARVRREAGDTLRETEERFRAVVESNMVGIGFWNLDGRITDANDTLLRMLGYAREEVAAGRLRFPDITPPEHYAADARCLAEIAATGTCTPYEKEYVRRDGTRVPVVLGAAAMPNDRTRGPFFALDITERKRAERELAEAHEFLHSSIDALSSHIAVLDESGVVLAVNDAWRRFADQNNFTGHDYAVGANYLGACEPTDQACIDSGMVAGLRGVLAGTLDLFEHEYPCHSATEHRWFVMRATRFKSPGPVRVVVAHEDVTKRKLAEEALREADRKKDEFLAILAHELRNPLAPLRTGLELVRRGAGQAERAWLMMERQVNQLVRLVDDLLDVSRITQGRLELRRGPVQLAAVIEGAVETARPLIDRARHDLTVVLPDRSVTLDGDAARLSQVFANLLTNAAKYTPPGGRIRVSAARDPGGVSVTVADNGVGIPPPMLPRVFDMFTQVDRTLEKTTGGLGIGLSLVKGLVEMHGGTVVAQSDGEGTGSTFTVHLPAQPPVCDAAPAANGKAAAAPVAARRVLVVDDNVDAAESLAQLLQLMGHDTRTAHEGEAGVEAAERFRPDLILLDIGMPRLNGYDAARRIRARPWGRSVVLVALTGWGQDDDRRRTAEAGFDHHLVKPVEPQVVLGLLAGLTPVPA